MTDCCTHECSLMRTASRLKTPAGRRTSPGPGVTVAREGSGGPSPRPRDGKNPPLKASFVEKSTRRNDNEDQQALRSGSKRRQGRQFLAPMAGPDDTNELHGGAMGEPEQPVVKLLHALRQDRAPDQLRA